MATRTGLLYNETRKNGTNIQVKRLKNYPYERNTKRPYFVEIQDDDSTYIEGFDTKKEAVEYAKKVK